MTKRVCVIDDLQRWGPDCRPSVPSLPEAEAYCRALAQSHYENFPVVTWLLPSHLRQHFYHVYAYCRWADDLGDETGDSARALSLLAWWRGELHTCHALSMGTLNAELTHPVMVALRETIRAFQIPRSPFDDLISAFEQDQAVKEYETFDQLVDYCRRSANPVGRILLYLCRSATEENLRLSDSICTGLQLANFWQDVARDAQIGRVYLPREDRERFGYTPTDLQSRTTNEAFLHLMQFEVDWARQFLRAGQPLVGRLPGRLQIDIDLFARGGLAILNGIERIGYRVWDRRPTVSKSELLLAGMQSIGQYLWRYASGRNTQGSDREAAASVR